VKQLNVKHITLDCQLERAKAAIPNTDPKARCYDTHLALLQVSKFISVSNIKLRRNKIKKHLKPKDISLRLPLRTDTITL